MAAWPPAAGRPLVPRYCPRAAACSNLLGSRRRAARSSSGLRCSRSLSAATSLRVTRRCSRVRTIEVRGGTPQLRRQVWLALRTEVGRSLLRVDASAIDEQLSTLSGLRSFSYDRAFPHTLRVVVRPERPVLVLRQGGDAYLVAAGGRVLRPLAHPHLSSLPRVYVTKDVKIDRRHDTVGGRCAAAAAAAVARGAASAGRRALRRRRPAQPDVAPRRRVRAAARRRCRPAPEGRDRPADPAPQHRR